MCSDGRSEVEMRTKVQAVSNAWRQVDGVMVDRAISRLLNGNLLGARTYSSVASHSGAYNISFVPLSGVSHIFLHCRWIAEQPTSFKIWLLRRYSEKQRHSRSISIAPEYA